MTSSIFVGLMSGTSLDGIDAVVVRLSEERGATHVDLLASCCEPFPSDIRHEILALCSPGAIEMDRLGELDVELGRLFARVTLRAVNAAGILAGDVSAIGSHGQTIRHRPDSAKPFTLQIGDPNTIAELTGITTVGDFRRRDVAAGGQGAPLVPAFHAALFRSAVENRAVINIGGMANVTLLPANPAEPVRGFDTGPGNVLLDAWHQRHCGTALDRDGKWAAGGSVDEELLSLLMAETYFSLPPPKSTGRELFCMDWLDARLVAHKVQLDPQDVQATLAELTAASIADALKRWGGTVCRVYLCGGGTHNSDLRKRIAARLPSAVVDSTAVLGIAPDWVEAIAFAWLAQRTIAGQPGNLPEVTGAGTPVVLGGIYPGRTRQG